jgi:CRP/FNR family cyclic AMP-dependent transcriptional regulator
MISIELIRRYPFFAGLNHDQLVALAKVANEVAVETEHYFFHEGDELESIYLVLQGSAAVVIEVPDREVEQKLSGQLTGKLQTKDVVISAVGPGEVFAWSALVPPYRATAGVKATTPCRVITFDRKALLTAFEDDCRFGYLMMQKTAQVVRDRLQGLRIESLAHTGE